MVLIFSLTSFIYKEDFLKSSRHDIEWELYGRQGTIQSVTKKNLLILKYVFKSLAQLEINNLIKKSDFKYFFLFFGNTRYVRNSHLYSAILQYQYLSMTNSGWCRKYKSEVLEVFKTETVLMKRVVTEPYLSFHTGRYCSMLLIFNMFRIVS